MAESVQSASVANNLAEVGQELVEGLEEERWTEVLGEAEVHIGTAVFSYYSFAEP